MKIKINEPMDRAELEKKVVEDMETLIQGLQEHKDKVIAFAVCYIYKNGEDAESKTTVVLNLAGSSQDVDDCIKEMMVQRLKSLGVLAPEEADQITNIVKLH